jgi:uncharacterized repeat protein (TIGR04138 family)
MHKIDFEEALRKIVAADPRYETQAYHFVREALDFTVKMLSKPVDGPGRHVSGAELLDGIRQHALQEFGPIAKTVLNRWGISHSEDFGEIVFNLVEQGILGRTDEDKREDFRGGYTFDEAFVRPFLPASRRQRRPSAVDHRVR